MWLGSFLLPTVPITLRLGRDFVKAARFLEDIRGSLLRPIFEAVLSVSNYSLKRSYFIGRTV